MEDLRKRTLYLLHFDTPLKGKQHYLGICLTDRIRTRLLEHAHGVGSPFTRELAKINSEFYCVRLWHNATYEKEKRRKMSANLKRSCPLCRSGQFDLSMKKLATDVRPEISIDPVGLSFASSAAKTQSEKPHEKRRRNR